MRRPSSSPSAPRAALVIAALWAVAIWAAEAGAHVGPQAGKFPFVVNGELVGGGTTWGVVLDDTLTGGGPYARVCEEALRTQNVYVYARAPTGRIYAGVLGGMRYSDDGGCSWHVAPGPFADAELDVTAIAVAADAPDVWYVPTGRFGFDNGVYKTTNGGASFAATGLVGEDVVLFDAITSPDGTRAWVSGLDPSLGTPLVRYTDDGGATWSAPAADLSSYALVSVLGLDDDRVMLAALDIQGGGVLLSAPYDVADYVEVDSFPNEITHYAKDGDTRLLIVRTTLMRAAPGEATYSIVPDVALTCVVKVPGQPGVWGCGQAGGGGQFLSSPDGLTWTTELGFTGVLERTCPICTEGAQCVRYLPDAGPVAPLDAGAEACLADGGVPGDDDAGNVVVNDDAGAAAGDAGVGGGDDDAGPDGGTDAPCACGASSSTQAPMAALALAAAAAALCARRRRR